MKGDDAWIVAAAAGAVVVLMVAASGNTKKGTGGQAGGSGWVGGSLAQNDERIRSLVNAMRADLEVLRVWEHPDEIHGRIQQFLVDLDEVFHYGSSDISVLMYRDTGDALLDVYAFYAVKNYIYSAGSEQLLSSPFRTWSINMLEMSDDDIEQALDVLKERPAA